MTAEIPISQSVHGLKNECLSYGEVLAQSVSVIAPTTVPAAVLSFAYGAAGNGTWLSFLLAIGFMSLPILGTVGIPSSTLFPAPPAPVSTFPYLFLLYLVAGCGWFFYQRLRSPRMARRMQQAVEEIHVRYSTGDRY